MTEVINLRQQRKAKLRKEKEAQAAQNRQLHGRTKTEKQLKKLQDERAKRLLDGHKREKDSD